MKSSIFYYLFYGYDVTPGPSTPTKIPKGKGSIERIMRHTKKKVFYHYSRKSSGLELVAKGRHKKLYSRKWNAFRILLKLGFLFTTFQKHAYQIQIGVINRTTALYT